MVITELSTPQRISRNSAKSWESPSQWARSARVLTTHWPNRSTQPSNAKSSKTTAAGPMRPPAAARSSDGCPATTPKEGTHTAVISAPPPTKGTRHPLRCPKPHNHKSRVHYPGSRPVFIDAIFVKIRDGQVANRPIYVAIGVTCAGERDILGLWVGDGGEGAKFWLAMLTEIKNRGTADVCMVVCDGLKGLSEAVSAVWDRAIIQTCVIHLLRNTFRYAGRQNWDRIAPRDPPGLHR